MRKGSLEFPGGPVRSKCDFSTGAAAVPREPPTCLGGSAGSPSPTRVQHRTSTGGLRPVWTVRCELISLPYVRCRTDGG
jgi:hypothetical protein